MHKISSMEELEQVDEPLLSFIKRSCPWLPEGFAIGSIIILEKGDSRFSQELQADLSEFDGWEDFTIFEAGYWHKVAIVGQEDGYAFFMSEEFVAGL